MSDDPPLSLSPKQLESIQRATKRVNLWDGAIRAGKTIASLLAFLLFVARAPRGGQIVIVARTRESAMRNVFAPLLDEALFGPIARQVKYTAGAPSGTILGRTVYVIGASDAKAEKVLRGLTVAGAYVDEVTVIPEEFFTQLLGRMSVTGARLFGTTNPDNPGHWLMRKFLKRIPADGAAPREGDLLDWYRAQFKMTDNPSLSPEYIASVEREFTGLWFRRFVLGEWVAGEGSIYPELILGKHVIAWEQLPPMRRLLAVGMDYGVTNATTALLLGIADEFDAYGKRTRSRLYLIDEWGYDPSDHQGIRLTNGELSDRFQDWLYAPDHLPGKHTAVRPERVYVDPGGGGSSLIVQLQKDGVKGVALPDKSVSYGIGTMSSLLTNGDLLVSDRCTGFLQEAPGYSWDEKATKKGEDAPIKVADHFLDGARYAVVSTESVWRRLLALAA